MKLVSLVLSAFRQHRHSTFRFPDGLIGVIGANGAGKTSLLEGVCFALFGTKALRGKLDDVRTRGLGRREGATAVSLLFEHEAILYRLERSLSDCSLYVGGESEPHVVGTREVTLAVSALLGMTYEEFAATYLTEQKGLEFLSAKKGATERERFIVRMMGYDRLERTQELLRIERRDRRANLSGLESGLGSREEIEARIASDRTAMAAIGAKHDEASRSVAVAERDFEAAKKRFEREEAKRLEASKVLKSIEAVGVRLEERRRRQRALIGEAEKLQGASATLDGSGTLDDVREALERGQARITLLRSREHEAREELGKEEAGWRDGLSTAKSELLTAQRAIAEADARRRKLLSVSEDPQCPTCGQPLGDSFHSVRSEADEAYQRALASERELRAKLASAELVPEPIARIRAEISELAGERSEAERKVAGLAAVARELETAARLRSELDTIAAESAELEAERTTLARRLGDTGFSEDAFLREKGAAEAAARLLEVSRLQRMKFEGELRAKEALLKRSETELATYDERARELVATRHALVVLDESDRVLTEFRRHLNASIRPRLAELASEFLADLTDGRYVAVDIGEDFTPTVLDDGVPKPIISGGEEDILNLCVRLALSNMLAERAGHTFSLLLLDEVFGSLDDNRRANVLVLLDRLRIRFDQIVVITHLDDVKEGVSHLIEVAYDDATGDLSVRSSSVFDDEPLAVNV